MNLSLMILIAVVVFFAAAFVYVLFFKKKGRKVFIEVYDTFGDKKPVLLNSKKREKGLLFIDGEVEKLKIPKKWSKFPLQPPPLTCIIQTKDSPFDIIRILRVAQDKYVYMDHALNETQYLAEVREQSDAYTWAVNEWRVNDKRTKNDDWWSKYGALALLGVIILGGLLTIYMTGQQINELNDDYRQQTLGEVNEQRSFMLDLVNNIKGEESSGAETNTPNKPAGATG